MARHSNVYLTDAAMYAMGAAIDEIKAWRAAHPGYHGTAMVETMVPNRIPAVCAKSANMGYKQIRVWRAEHKEVTK